MKRYVKPTLEYLEELRGSGHVPIDFDVTAPIPNEEYRIVVPTHDGQYFEFIIQADSKTMAAHQHEAVRFAEYGANGLASLLNADVHEASAKAGSSSWTRPISMGQSRSHSSAASFSYA